MIQYVTRIRTRITKNTRGAANYSISGIKRLDAVLL